MALFDAGSPAYQTASGTNAAVKVWSGTVSALASISPAVTLRDISIVNVGTTTVYLGGSSVTSATGLAVPAGAQVTIQGWQATSNTTTNDVYGITSAGTLTFRTAAGLATNAWVV